MNLAHRLHVALVIVKYTHIFRVIFCVCVWGGGGYFLRAEFFIGKKFPGVNFPEDVLYGRNLPGLIY